MTAPYNPRTSAALRRYASINRTVSQPLVERLLRFIGADIAFTDDVLGDLAEERSRRGERDGAWPASWWYIREVFRSAPHLAWNAVQHGGQRGRARVAAIVAAMALVLTVVVSALRSGDDVAVRLEVDGQRAANSADGIIVNTRHPVLLAMRAFDAKGKALKSAKVRYGWMSGAPVSVSAKGVVTCAYAGDAVVRASLGALATAVRVHCLPVREVRADMWIHLIVGGPPHELAFVALDPDGLPVNRLAGELRVNDSSIATLEKGRIRPLAPGHTYASMHFGDGKALTEVSVYERVRTLDGLRDDQDFVVAPLRLARGDTIRWTLPTGPFWLIYRRDSSAQPVPLLAVDGPAVCMPVPSFEPAVELMNCLARGPGALLRMALRGATTSEITGALALERQKDP